MKVYYAFCSSFESSFYEKALHLIPKQKREKLESMKNTESRKESTLGWLLCVLALKEAGYTAADFTFGEREKPYCKSGELFFNITHSHGLVMCAVSDCEIGIDTEKVRSCSSAVMQKVLCERELCAVSESENSTESFIKLWTIKESVLKQNGLGITGGFQQYDFSDCMSMEQFEKYSLCFFTGKIADYPYCVCSRDRAFEIANAESLLRNID